MKRKLLSALLALSLTFSLSAAPAAALTLDEALDKARHFLGQELDVRTIIMPHGASTLPKLAV